MDFSKTLFSYVFGFLGFVFSVYSHAYSVSTNSSPLAKIEVTVLQGGTVNWELQHLKNQRYDEKNGFLLELRKVASLPAARLALTSGSTDMIVSDWLWAGKQNQQGQKLRFMPFSNQIGTVIKGKHTSAQAIKTMADLRGKKIGIAGSPLNKGWILLQAAAHKEGIDLKQESSVQFASPPLLNQALKRGQIDLLVTFWHFGERLKTEGFEVYVELSQLMEQLGLHSRMPMLGYVFNVQLEQKKPTLIRHFYTAIQQTKADLQSNDLAWQTLRPLLKAQTHAIEKALIAGYRAGHPTDLTQEQIDDAVKFFALVQSQQGSSQGKALNPAIFYQP